MDIILLQFKRKPSYATELAEEIIGFAVKKYEERENVKFLILDITDESGFLGIPGTMLYLRSIYTMFRICTKLLRIFTSY